jgi:hypothetical protein
MPGQKKERLLAACESSTALYLMWVKRLPEATGAMAPCDAYEDLRKLAEEAMRDSHLRGTRDADSARTSRDRAVVFLLFREFYVILCVRTTLKVRKAWVSRVTSEMCGTRFSR